MFDPYGPLINNETHKPQPAAPRSETPKPPAVKTPAANVTPPDHSAKLRIDSAFADGWSEVPPPHTGIPVGATPQSRPRPPKLTEREMPGGHRADSPSRLQGPHFNPARMNHRPPENNSWVAWFGQTLAYLGAATLTIGAGMVLVGYMGGPSHYAPTGWFTTTVGQMLLFLGVVTLVSAGMEQTTVEVAKRIDVLGDQLERMEYSAQAKSSATDPELEAELRAEIAQLRQQLSEHRRD